MGSLIAKCLSDRTLHLSDRAIDDYESAPPFTFCFEKSKLPNIIYKGREWYLWTSVISAVGIIVATTIAIQQRNEKTILGYATFSVGALGVDMIHSLYTVARATKALNYLHNHTRQ